MTIWLDWEVPITLVKKLIVGVYMNRIAGSAILLLSTSCVIHSYPRTSVWVREIDGFIFSNTQTNPYSFFAHSNEAKFTYTLIAKNTNPKQSAIDLSEAYINFDSKGVSDINCYDYKNKESHKISIDTNQQVRIECDISIDTSKFPSLKNQDTIAQIVIPFSAKGQVSFDYKFKLEDFQ